MRPAFSSRFLRTSVGIAVIVTVGVLLWALFVALRPLPGRDVTIATGPLRQCLRAGRRALS